MCERARGSKFSLLRGANGGEKGRDAAGDVPFSVSPQRWRREEAQRGSQVQKRERGKIPLGQDGRRPFSGGEMEGGSLVSANDCKVNVIS